VFSHSIMIRNGINHVQQYPKIDYGALLQSTTIKIGNGIFVKWTRNIIKLAIQNSTYMTFRSGTTKMVCTNYVFLL
jgi:hypothetical protein